MQIKECRGNKASYMLNTRLGKGEFGQAWKGSVHSIEQSKKWLSEPAPHVGTSVVIKWANLQNEYSAFENRRFLQDVNAAINSELSSLERLSTLECIARVHDYGHVDLKLSDGSPQAAIFLVEEFLDGTRLDKFLFEKFGRTLSGKKTFHGIDNSSSFLELAINLASAVRDIHHRGIIHGDIWPENIMVIGQGSLKFFDLGASAIRDTIFLRPDTLVQPRSDNYCAPERRHGERHGRRSDIYSLGGLFYFMATGVCPPSPNADIDELKNRIVADIENSNPALIYSNFGIADIIARCLRYNKDQRVRDADALLNELRLFSMPGTNVGFQLSATSESCFKCLLGEGIRLDDLSERMLKIDIARLKSRANDIRRGIIEISGDHEDIVFGMSAYLSVLTKGDSFLARTTPRFWKAENLGINGRFLSMLRLAAQGGVDIQYLMLVCESDRTEPEYRRILEAHLKAMNQFNPSKNGKLSFFCKVVSADDRHNFIHKFRWECCYTISNNEIKALQPVYDRKDILRTVRFIKQEPSTIARIRAGIEKEFSEAVSLMDWMSSEILPS